MSTRQKMIVIRTQRLVLRLADPFSSSDCTDILRIISDPDTAKHSVSGINTMTDIQEKYKQHGPRPEFCTLAAPPYGMYFLVYLAASDHEEGHDVELIGEVLMSFRPEMPCPDLGYGLLPSYQGRGYATEAALAAVKFWRDTIGVKDISIGTAPQNIKSQKIAERLGFVKGGTFDVIFGHPPNEKRDTGGLAFVLPGMAWEEGRTMKLTIGRQVESSEGPPEVEHR